MDNVYTLYNLIEEVVYLPNYTKKLGIRLLEGSDRFVDTSFNNILNDMDSKLVGISHLSSCAHFAVWDANVAYVSGDVVRTPYLKSGQYLECMASGTSGSSVPQYNIDGTNFTDGTVSWVVRSFSSAVRNIITEWASGVSYSVGSLVLYGNALYRAKMLHTSTAFSLDVGKWQEVYASVRIWKANVFYDINDSVLYEDVLYRCISANSRTTFNPSDWVMVNNLSPVADWASSTVYYKNQLVVHQGALYRATSSHISASTFSVDYLANQWDMVKANVSIWQSGFDYFVDDVVFCDNTCYICVAQHTSSANIAQDMVNWNILIRNSAYLQDWTPNAFFDVGQVVIYKGNLYRCLTSNTDATFTNSNWELIVQFLSLWQTNTAYSVGAVVLHDSKLYQCDTLHTSDASSFYNDRGLWTEISRTTIEDWAQNFPYTVGDMCTYNQKIFKCTGSHISGTTFTDTYFAELSPNYLYNWSNGTNYHINDVVIYGRALYRCLSNHLSSNFSADSIYWESLTSITSWIPGWTYIAGDFVTNGSNPHIYRCIKGHVSSSNFASDEFTSWIKVGSDNILLEWYPNTAYDKYQLVHVDRVLYRANASHTSSTSFANDASKWDLIYANISTYVNGAYYLAGSLVIYGRILYRCVKSYQSTTAYLDGTKWEIIGGSSSIPNWETNKKYYADNVVFSDNVLYRCTANHTSGSFNTDLGDGYWIKVSGGSSGGSGTSNYSQKILMNVTAPKTYEIKIAKTTDFCFPPVEVLKFKAGQTDVVVDALTFDLSDGKLFKVDGISSEKSPYALYDKGKLYLNTEYKYKHGSATSCGNGYVTISDEIDLSNFKSVKSVEVV